MSFVLSCNGKLCDHSDSTAYNFISAVTIFGHVGKI